MQPVMMSTTFLGIKSVAVSYSVESSWLFPTWVDHLAIVLVRSSEAIEFLPSIHPSILRSRNVPTLYVHVRTQCMSGAQQYTEAATRA